MKSTVLLAANLLLHRSSDGFDLTVVYGPKPAFKIRSDQKIIFFCVLPSMKREFMQKNTTVTYHHVMVVDNVLGWCIYCIKDLQTETPKQIYHGKFVSERSELKKLVGVHEVDGKIIVIFDKMNFYYLTLPKEVKEGSYLINKEFVPFGGQPTFQHQDFTALKGFLPQDQEYDILVTHYSLIDQENSIFFVALESKSSHLSSIYTLQYDRKKAHLMSGKNVLLNINAKTIQIYPTDLKEVFLVQNQTSFILWSLQTDKKEGKFELHNERFSSFLTKNISKEGVEYSAVTQTNRVILISVEKGSGKLKQSQFPQRTVEDFSLLQFFPNLKSNEHYFLTKKQELYLSTPNGSQKILGNQYTQITKSKLCSSQSHNFLIVDKKRGDLKEKILFGNHFFAYNSENYTHGMMLNTCDSVEKGNSLDQCWVYLSSPLVGLLKLNISLNEQAQAKTTKGKQGKKQSIKNESVPQKKSFAVSLDKTQKLVNDQTLYMNQKFQITSEEVIEVNKKSVKISRLFQNSIDFISAALVLSNDLIVLSVFQQIHVFDSKLTRKYIYCFNSPIKDIFSLNDFNVIGVQLYESAPDIVDNQLHILILEQQKGSKMKSISIPDVFNFFQLHTVINTAQYRLNVFGEKLVVCSNDSLHKYQLQKITVDEYVLPLPQTNLTTKQILPLTTLGRENHRSDFIVVFREEPLTSQKKNDQVQVYLASFNHKYLFKKIDLGEVYLNYQRILTLSEMPKDRLLFACRYVFQEGVGKGTQNYCNLILLGEKTVSTWALKYGRIELEWVQDSRYLLSELQKIENIPREVVQASHLLDISEPITLLPTSRNEYYLLCNQREIYFVCYQAQRISKISYYSLINDDFTTFRNNLNLNELNDSAFMGNFSMKMRIKDVRYLTDRIIFVLFELCIIVLEIGANNSLVVRQELKFRSNEMNEVMKIQEFLQNYDEESIYLRQSHGRIYLLRNVEKTYEIIFHSYMDEDVLLFSRLNQWYQRDRTYLLNPPEQSKEYQELVLKKDGQLTVKSIEQKKEDIDKMVYI